MQNHPAKNTANRTIISEEGGYEASILVDDSLHDYDYSWNIRFSDAHVFHVALRKRQSTLVLNELFEGAFFEETRVPYLQGGRFLINLTFLRQKARLFVDGALVVERDLIADLGDEPLGMPDWQAPGSDSGGIASGQKTTEIAIMRQVATVPSAAFVAKLNPKDVDLIRLFADAANLLGFGERPVFVDLSHTAGTLSSVIRSIYPRADIFCVNNDSDEARLVEELCSAAGITIQTVERKALRTILNHQKKAPVRNDRVVVIASDIYSGNDKYKFDLLADICAEWPNVTVVANESAPVPAHAIFKPSASLDAYIKVFWSDWRFIWARDRQRGRKPQLDVVVAMYNAKEYIEECVRSLNVEGRPDVRVLVVDDGSTDGSDEIVSHLAKEFPYIVLLKKSNGGCASARNFGRLNSEASHIAFVDADDYIDAGAFGYLFDLALYSSFPAVQCGFVTDGLAQQEEGSEFSDAHLADYHNFSFFMDRKVVRLPSNNVLREAPGIWRRVYRRDFLDGRNIWFPEHIRAYDDFIFFVLTARYASEILHAPAHKYYYRQHPNQDVRKRDARHFYIIEMGHMLLHRAITEGWQDISVLVEVLRASANWSLKRIDVKYLGKYVSSVASLVASIETAFGQSVFSCAPGDFISHMDFRTAYSMERDCFIKSGLATSYASGFIRTSGMNAEIVEAISAIQDRRILTVPL